MADKDNASFRRKQENLKQLFHPVATMDQLIKKKEEAAGLPEELHKTKDEPEGKVMVTDISGRQPHRHTAIVDDDGNGRTKRTFDDDPHEHDIAGGKVMQSGMVPHIHELEEA